MEEGRRVRLIKGRRLLEDVGSRVVADLDGSGSEVRLRHRLFSYDVHRGLHASGSGGIVDPPGFRSCSKDRHFISTL